MAEFHLTGKSLVPVALLACGPWILGNPSIFEQWAPEPITLEKSEKKFPKLQALLYVVE